VPGLGRSDHLQQHACPRAYNSSARDPFWHIPRRRPTPATISKAARVRARSLMTSDEHTALLVSNPCLVPGVVTQNVTSTQARAGRRPPPPALHRRWARRLRVAPAAC
jgi:hypothetical protein